MPMKKLIPVIPIAWISSLVTTLAIVYGSPSIFPPLGSRSISDEAIDADKIAPGAVIAAKLADGSVISAKILDGTITTADLADGSLTTVKIADGVVTATKIADYSVESLKLAPSSVPFAYTSSTGVASTTSTTFVDMTDTSVTINLARTSHLLIIFTAEARVNPAGGVIYLQARVGTDLAVPDSNEYELIPPTNYNTYTFTFYKPSATAGTYSVNIRWYATMNTAYAYKRALTVLALPA